MKKVKEMLKKALCAMSALTIALGGLTACGGSGDPMANAALAKENVYRMQEISFPDFGGDYNSVQASYLWDGRIYVMMQVYHWTYYEGSNQDYRLVSMNQDGSDVQEVSLQMPAAKNIDEFVNEALGGSDTEPGQNENEGDVNGGDVPDEPDVDDDVISGVMPLTADEPVDDGENIPADIPEEDVGYGEVDVDIDVDYEKPYPELDVSFGRFAFANGRIYALEYCSYYYYSEVDYEGRYIQKPYVCCWEMDGSLVWESEMESLNPDDDTWLYVNVMLPKQDGSITMLLTGSATYKQEVSADGVIGSRDAFNSDNAYLLGRAYYLLPKADGTLVVVYTDENDWTKMYIANYDIDKDQLGEAKQMPSSFAYNYYSPSAGLNSDLIYSDNNGVYTFNAGDEAGTKKMDFINSDVGITYLQNLMELSDNSFLGLYNTDEGKMSGGIFTYVPPEEIPDKKVLILAGEYIPYELRNRVVEFNRNSDEYRITMRTYDSYNSYEDWTAGATQLNNDIITGNMPDILVVNNLPVENYIAKGLIEDIGKMIEGDEELSQVEFVQNVFDAYSMNGKLYYVIPSFYIRTMIGKISLVGDRSTWTMADMRETMAGLPEETTLFGADITRGGFFNTMMQFSGADFVDVGTGKCDFDTPGFISIMEYAKNLPQELDEDFWSDEDYWGKYESQYRENRTVLYQLYISSFSYLNREINGNIGEDVSYIGFPTESGMGSVVGLNDAYCISSKSANKDAAWEFLRYYLTDDYQNKLQWGLPVKKARLEELAQEATKPPYYIDENGDKHEYEYPETIWINGEEIILLPMSQEQVDKCVNFIYSVNKPIYSNDDIMTIINEEMESFYSGQKGAEEVAKVIQSRAQIYVDTNR